jgi:signal peptidase I
MLHQIFQLLLPLINVLALLATPLIALAIIDDWFLRPGRRLRALPEMASDPLWATTLYYLVPILVICGIIHLLMSERLDFSLVLVLVTVVSGLVWAVDHWVAAPRRARQADLQGKNVGSIPLPVTVDYARSFLPVAALVLIIRAFIFEPFRIPSDSMMPTLQDGDFIVVNKFAYGLRMPVLDTKILNVGEPQRGDVVVFRWPVDPAINYIKRLVGLPGDTVRIKDDQLIINGKSVPAFDVARYNDGCYSNFRLMSETLGTHTHQTLSCRTPDSIGAPVSPSCNRRLDRSYLCTEPPPGEATDRGDSDEFTVPAGSYLMIGDNRDNSEDSRFWGFVPEKNLVGKASRIWFNWDWGRTGGPIWSRIGHKIE